jgi:HEAT repeat protein
MSLLPPHRFPAFLHDGIWFVALLAEIALGGAVLLNNTATASEMSAKADTSSTLSPQLRMLVEKTNCRDPRLRAEAARELGDMGKEAALCVPFLIRLLEDDSSVNGGPEVTVGSVARVAIAKIGEPAVGPCVAALKTSESGELRQRLLLLFGQFEDARAVAALLAPLDDSSAQVRATAIWTLTYSTDPRIVGPLLVAFDDKDASVREAAVGHFRHHRDPRAITPLLDVAMERSASHRRSAILALGAQRDPRAVPHLLRILETVEKDLEMRMEAAHALGSIGDAIALEPLVAILTDRNERMSLRAAAAVALGRLSDDRALDPLVSVLRTTGEAPFLRATAAEGLASLKTIAAVPPLLAIIRTPGESDRVRWWAALSVVEITEGAVEDVAVVTTLAGGYMPESWEGMSAGESRGKYRTDGLKAVANRGKTTAVRRAAQRALDRLAGRRSLGSILAELCGVYYFFALAFWALANRHSLRKRQFTMRSLFVLVTLVAIGLPLLAGLIAQMSG